MKTEVDQQKTFSEAMDLLKNGRPLDAVQNFENLIGREGNNSACLSWLGVALARSGSDLPRAEKFAIMAVEKDPYVPQYRINLAEIYHLNGDKVKAVKVLKESIPYDTANRIIARELARFGIRRPPVIPFLSRSNPVNKHIGLWLTKLGSR